LIDKRGNVLDRHGSATKPEKIAKDIEASTKQSNIMLNVEVKKKKFSIKGINSQP
jgi:hypothetical protein